MIALVLAADASASVSFDEFGLIAGGMAAALRDPRVAESLARDGALLAAMIFSEAQDVTVDWTRIGSSADLAGFADRVESMPRVVTPRLTAIGDALLAANALFARMPHGAARRIVDLAGDGRANAGTPPGPVRDRMAQAGITINGLCVLHEEPDLVLTFTEEVIGGPGAFAQPCADYAAFAEAMRRKLLREALIA